jgi:hypothetical protein
MSKSIVEKDPRYKDFEITWSNDNGQSLVS